MTDFDDPRVEKLPGWARDLIARGKNAASNADHWRAKADQRADEIEALKYRYAAERGAAEFDTWVSEGYDPEKDMDIRFGLGTGREVHFGGQTELTPDFIVTFRDGGLDIKVDSSITTIKANHYGHDPSIRIER